MWTIHSGVLPGPAHLKVGEPSQDSFAHGQVGTTILLAVADGAGSHRRSGEGASLVTLLAVEHLGTLLEGGAPLSEELLEEVLEEVHQELRAQEGSHEMGCTLALAAANEEEWVALVVGDSFVVVHGAAGEHLFIQPERRSEYANVTDLLSKEVIYPVVASGRGHRGLSLSSDGLLSTTIKDGVPAQGVWEPLVKRGLEGSLEVQDFLDFMEGKGLIEDDTTLLMGLLDPEASSEGERGQE